MKLGINFKTGHKWSLTSWISEEVPASGSFTFGGDPNGTSQLVIWWRGGVSWTSGLWRDGYFDNTTQLSNEDYYSFSYVSNEDEKYLTYSVNSSNTSPRYTIQPYGAVYDRNGMSPFGDCDFRRYAFPGCGFSMGASPECRKNNRWSGQDQGFVYGDGFKYDERSNLSFYDCKQICWNNCSCVACASTSLNGTGCEIWSRVTSYETSPDSYTRRTFVFIQSETETG
ncbi:unnamed protein product [Ilex paraguariensis]|uniref:Apple domain-containing protein n=1 Tax=Ilex paraguariensis TaxID=185542 RepID=A0ABC8UXA3_9AQUA